MARGKWAAAGFPGPARAPDSVYPEKTSVFGCPGAFRGIAGGGAAWLPILLALAMPLLSGCLGRFAANQGRRQAARSSDFYLKKYVEPELSELYPDDPEARIEIKKMTRQGRNWLAEVVVHSRGKSVNRKVLVNEAGKVLERW